MAETEPTRSKTKIAHDAGKSRKSGVRKGVVGRSAGPGRSDNDQVELGYVSSRQRSWRSWVALFKTVWKRCVGWSVRGPEKWPARALSAEGPSLFQFRGRHARCVDGGWRDGTTWAWGRQLSLVGGPSNFEASQRGVEEEKT